MHSQCTCMVGFDDIIVILLPLMMICYVMIRWMLGWCDMHARWTLRDAMLDEC